MPLDLADLFAAYDDLAGDVVRSEYTFFKVNLKRWFEFLDTRSPFARPILQQLEPAAHFPTWFEPYRRAMVTGGGSEAFRWPDDQRQRLGMQLHLLRRMGGDEIDPGLFALTVLHIGSIHKGIATIISQIFVPASRELRRYLQEQIAIEAARAEAAALPDHILAELGLGKPGRPAAAKPAKRGPSSGGVSRSRRSPASPGRRNRDDFLDSTRRALALRAGYLCSLPDCQKPTAGPSAESSSAVVVLGEAAHIRAASPGGARYDPAMSPDERSHIDNGIWLCSDHATLIDRDRVTYTVEKLRAIKRAHESERTKSLLNPAATRAEKLDLVAVGPEIVCVGELIGIGDAAWKLRLEHFVIGDVGNLVDFAEGVMRRPPGERYVLVNALGDGRQLSASAVLDKSGGIYELTCPVLPKAARDNAQDLGTDLALSPKNDRYVENGSIAVVSGVNALSQRIRTCLSLAKGESPFHQDFGTRLAEYYEDYRNTPWLGRLIKLEVVRQAAIPYHDSIQNRDYTPLQCVERVREVEALADAPKDNRLPVHLALDVQGIGRWESEMPIYLPDRTARQRGQEMALRLFGASPTKEQG